MSVECRVEGRLAIGVGWGHRDSPDGQQLTAEECGRSACSEAGLSQAVEGKAGHRDGSQG